MLRVTVEIVKRLRPPLGDSASRAAVREAFRRAGIRRAVRVTLVWTDDREMRRLNRMHRGSDKTTDVLSFPLPAGNWPSAGAEAGDIVLSVPEARREALREGRTIRDECLLLLVHGALHLLGHDHVRPRDRKRMFTLQDRILRSLGADASVLLL